MMLFLSQLLALFSDFFVFERKGSSYNEVRDIVIHKQKLLISASRSCDLASGGRRSFSILQCIKKWDFFQGELSTALCFMGKKTSQNITSHNTDNREPKANDEVIVKRDMNTEPRKNNDLRTNRYPIADGYVGQ